MTEMEYRTLIYNFVARIPPGKVATFGMLAALVGNPGAARRAAKAVACAPDGLPCHRVVKSGGELVPECVFGPGEQRARLLSEGVLFLQNGRVDMKNHLWQLEEARTQ
jgi:methylated-DNA-protein-cysteine methyltransferase related protein